MGPATYSTNSEIGMLVDGYEHPQMIMTPHARPYAKGFVESYGGFQKSMDLFCWYTSVDKMNPAKGGKIPEKLARVVEKIRQKHRFEVRLVDMPHLKDDIEKVKVIYNQAWAKNWGFVPMGDEELDYLAAGIKDMIDPTIAMFVEVDGQPVAFGLPLPDVYEPLRKARCKPGEPSWLQLLRLIWHWKIAGRIRKTRVWALGVLKEYRYAGVDALMYYEMLKAGMKRGYVASEMGWTLENNDSVNLIARMFDARAYKTYRVFEKPLAAKDTGRKSRKGSK
jgi:hypothetical protein